MKQRDLLILVVFVIVLIILCCLCRHNTKSHHHPDNFESRLKTVEKKAQNSQIAIVNLQENASRVPWHFSSRGQASETLDYNKWVTTSRQLLPFETKLAHHFSGPVNVPYDVEMLITSPGFGLPPTMAIEEAPPSEAWSGTYTGATQILYEQATPPLIGVDRINFTVTPTLEDSVWLYSCKGGASTYLISLSVTEQ